MPTTELPPAKEKAHEITRRIANERPMRKEPDPAAHPAGDDPPRRPGGAENGDAPRGGPGRDATPDAHAEAGR